MSTRVRLTDKFETGETVAESHFGLNFVFEYERIGDRPWEKFDDIAESLDTQFIRYPGGTAAETVFDIYDPNATRFVKPDGEVLNLMGLDRFLDYTSAQEMQPIIIVPTYALMHYPDGDSRKDFNPIHEDAVRAFVRSALEQAGPSGIKAFELGNEYESYMTSIEYGRVASSLAEIVQDEIDQYKADLPASATFNEPDISVQIWGQSVHGGISLEELELRNERVMAEFDDTEMAAVDALVSHFYYYEGRHDGEVNEHRYDNIDTSISYATDLMQDWARAGHTGLDFVFSEWNVLFQSDSNIGLSQAPVLLEMFTSFISQGVDQLDFWSAQYHATSLAQSNGQMMMAGILFELMKDNVMGGEVLDLPQVSDDYALHGFDMGNQVVLFFSSATPAEQELSVLLSGDWDNYTVSSATHIGVDESTADGSYRKLRDLEAYEDPDATLDVTQVDVDSLTIADGFELDLGAHEVMMVTLNAPPMRDSRANETGTSRADILSLDAKGGQLKGLAGNDVLESGRGNDRMDGGAGHDRLIGSKGVDAMIGGRGSDTFEFNDIPTHTTIEDFTLGVDAVDLTGLSQQSSYFQLNVGDTGFGRMSAGSQDDLYGSVSVAARQVGDDTHLRISEDGKLTGRIVLKDIEMDDLSMSDFGFGG